MEANFILPFILFLLGGFSSLIVKNKKILTLILNVNSFFAFCFFGYLLIQNFAHNPETKLFYLFGNFSREVGIEYSLNALNISILTFLSFLMILFSIFFAGFVLKYEKDFNFNVLFCIIQIFCASSFAILMTNDLFNFYIFFELLAICAYIFTSLGGKGSSYSALNYLILGVIASGLLVIGIGFIYFSTGFLNITKASEVLRLGNVNLSIPFIFISIGFLMKLAIFPFSFWQGLVYKSMPIAILPLYSSVVAIVTFYGFNLFFINFFINLDFIYIFKNILILLVILGVLVFSFFSLFENDVKKIFAYSSISQISYAVFILFLDFGKGSEFAFLHLFSNSLSKFALFIILFGLGNEKNIYNISVFEGLSYNSKSLCFVILFLFAGVIGLPLTLGFFTKISMILTSIGTQDYLFIAIILVGAILNFLYFWRIANVMFFKKKDTEISLSLSVKIPLILSLIGLLSLTLLFGYISSFEKEAVISFSNF